MQDSLTARVYLEKIGSEPTQLGGDPYTRSAWLRLRYLRNDRFRNQKRYLGLPCLGQHRDFVVNGGFDSHALDMRESEG